MSTISKVICDIEGCGEEAVHKQKVVSVQFVTEQTEGRPVPAYLAGQQLDFCKPHFQDYIENLPIVASGAQGFNKYRLTAGKSGNVPS